MFKQNIENFKQAFKISNKLAFKCNELYIFWLNFYHLVYCLTNFEANLAQVNWIRIF